jgi:hypothetical protein
MDVNVNERKVHKVHIQDKKVKEQRADRCSWVTLYVQRHRTTTTTMPNKSQQTKVKFKVVMLKLLLKRKQKS